MQKIHRENLQMVDRMTKVQPAYLKVHSLSSTATTSVTPSNKKRNDLTPLTLINEAKQENINHTPRNLSLNCP